MYLRAANLKALLVVPVLIACIAFSAMTPSSSSTTDPPLTELEKLGRQLFFDPELSNPPGLSCASCHSPSAGFSDPLHRDVSEGARKATFGNRNAPTIAYASYSPDFNFNAESEDYVGGQFADGRAQNLLAQVHGPLTNPAEMNSTIEDVVQHVQGEAYRRQFANLFGEDVLKDTTKCFEAVVTAIVAFEQSAEVNSFSSKFDAFVAGSTVFTPSEIRGMLLYTDPAKGNCAACHPITPTDDVGFALFTDFTYDNLGTPRNPDNPFYSQQHNGEGLAFVDLGLGGALGDSTHYGRFKVPTLRNVANTAPYMHNGVFKTLKEVVDFYNKRDLDSVVAEYPINVNQDELGDLGLTETEVNDIVAFLNTLTDGYQLSEQGAPGAISSK